MRLVKFTFKKSYNIYVLWYIFIVVLDLIVLSTYFTIFHFNKYIYFGPGHIHISETFTNKNIDLSNCLGIVSIDRNSQIFIHGRLLEISQFHQHAKNWTIKHNSFVLIHCENNSNLHDLFLIMEIFEQLDIPKVYISNINNNNS